MKKERKLEKGDTVWIVHGLKYGGSHGIAWVAKSEVTRAIDDVNFNIGGGAIHELGESAFYEGAETRKRALSLQASKILSLPGYLQSHLDSLTELMGGTGLDGLRKTNGWNYGNFDAWEFLCPDCKREAMQVEFMFRLQMSRHIAGIPFVIGSGWRCCVRNAAVGGAVASSHMRGLAADIIATTSYERFIILRSLLQAGFMRIGIAKFYIHVDSDPRKPQGILYLYKTRANDDHDNAEY